MNRSAKYLMLIVPTFAVAWAAIFIRLADANPVSTALYRMSFAALFLLPYGVRGLKSAMTEMTRKDFLLLVSSGLVLGVHFAAWITSLKYTTIANSVIIVSTQPFFVAVAEAIMWRTKIATRAIIGMAIAFVGMALITGMGFGVDSANLLGEFLAFVGAVCAGIYLMVGRKLRQNLDNRHYIFPVYFIAAVTLFIIGMATGAPLTGFSDSTWVYFILLALIPTVIGHSLYNYLLKYIKAHLVGLTILGEPIGAIILGAIIFGEYPTIQAGIGGVLILIGITFALFRKKSDVTGVESP